MAGKIITIDWELIAQLPSDEYHLKLLNKQQAAVLLALCEYQHWKTRWDNLALSQQELDRFMGDIEYRLMGDEGGFMTPEELKNAIAEGQYLAFNRLAAQVVSGRYTNITVGDDGTVSDPTTDNGVELPDDDPATPFDDSLAAQYGGSVSLAAWIEQFLSRIDAYYGATNGTPATPVADTKFFIKSFFPCDEAAMDTAIDNYYSYRTTNNRILFSATTTFTQFLFCNGNNEQAWQRWMIDRSLYSAQLLAVVLNLTAALADEFWQNSYSEGTSAPSSAYNDAPCTKIPDETITLTAFSASVVTVGLWKPYHRMQLKVSGFHTDPDGDLQDFTYYRTAAGVVSFAGSLQIVAGGVFAGPSSLVVPYRNDHVYTFTLDVPFNGGANLAAQFTFFRAGGMNVATPFSPMTIEIKDLGQYKL